MNIKPSFPFGIICIVVVSLALSSCEKQKGSTEPTTSAVIGVIPKTLGTISVPADNPMTDAKIELGRHLFFDKELSVDHSTSCATCHNPSAGFSDLRGLRTSMGFGQRMGTRNAPSLANVAYNTIFTWDGSFKTLEAHAPGPIFNSLEMGNNFSTGRDPRDSVPSGYHSDPGSSDSNQLFARLNGQSDAAGKRLPELYTAAFSTQKISIAGIAKAIATYERTFISTQSTFDKFNNGDESAYKNNPQALHGYQLFIDKNGANCISCHSGYNFTDQQFHDNGIGVLPTGSASSTDMGRSAVTKNKSDNFKFKTPSLRNVALSAPYMHDGRFATLTQVLNHYNKGGVGTSVDANQDQHVHALNLSDGDIADIIEFLKTLSDERFTVNPKYIDPWGK